MASSKSSSPAAYNDVKFVMEMAVNKPGLKYELKTPGAAINFKQRCNRYRNMLREMAAEQIKHIPGMRAETMFDILVIRQFDASGVPSNMGCILVFDHQQLGGKLIDPETNSEIEIPGVTDYLKEQ